jgi:hypothetical protein
MAKRCVIARWVIRRPQPNQSTSALSFPKALEAGILGAKSTKIRLISTSFGHFNGTFAATLEACHRIRVPMGS